MDLWSEFEMSERIAAMWQELGLSAGTSIIVLIALYFVIKWAVKKGIMEACKELTKIKEQEHAAHSPTPPSSS